MSTDPERLNPQFIAHQRARLEQMRAELLGGEQETLARERHIQEESGGEAEEYEETAQQMAQREVNQALRDTDKPRLETIERALQKIDEGSYGVSDSSGAAIPLERLEVVPEAIFTVEEERLREARDRRS